MEAIREVIPHAQLVQTEDLGKTYATPELAYQARHENERRWASLDLLCGRFDRNVEMRGFFDAAGIDMDAVRERCTCPPDILGFNYYITGERMLDHRIERYRGIAPGGNGRDRYVDIEAVRAREEPLGGIAVLGREAWERYHRPIAITEAHLASSGDEQIRWLEDLYMQTLALKASGADVKAFTVWSLFGAFDWDSLLTVHAGSYETGCFDVSSGFAQPTLIAQWIAARARGARFEHPVLTSEGWWRRDDRMIVERNVLAS
jgi:dTDP-4-dehydrorhamnose reductase